MTLFRKTNLAMAAAALTILPASLAQADLSPSERAAIDGLSGVRVYSSDGAFVGLTNGLRFTGDRVRLFLVPKAGSIFRRGGQDVIITTYADKLDLQDGNVIVAANQQQLKVRANRASGRGMGATTIHLLGRR